MATVAEHIEKANAIFDWEITKARMVGYFIGLATGLIVGVLAAI